MAKLEPYDYQAWDLTRLRSAGYRGLLNMGTGSGKTAETLFAVRESNPTTTLIIAPEQTHQSAWLPTIQNILDTEGRVIGNGNKAKKQALFDLEMGYGGVYLCTPELFTRADVSAWSGDFLAVDESHKLSTPKSKGQRKLSGYHVSDGEPLVRRFDGRLMLSGTPLRNRFELAWSYGRALWNEMYRRGEPGYDNFYAWQAMYMKYQNVYTNQRDANGQPKVVKQYLSEINPGQWLSEAPCVITHLKRENCCPYHPSGYLSLEEPTVKREIITLHPAQKKAIRGLEDHYMTWLGDNPMVCDLPLTKATRIRQLSLGVPTVTYDEQDNAEVTFETNCISPFYDRLEEFLRDEAADENVVVFVDSAKFARVVTDRLNARGISAFEFSGQTRATRNAQAREFGTTYRVLVGVLAAIAEGYDGLQKVSNTEVWLSRSTDETINEQAEGRLFRIGQHKQVLRLELVDDLGLAEGRYSEAMEKRLMLNRSLRRVA